jgi:hypothetical protein
VSTQSTSRPSLHLKTRSVSGVPIPGRKKPIDRVRVGCRDECRPIRASADQIFSGGGNGSGSPGQAARDPSLGAGARATSCMSGRVPRCLLFFATLAHLTETNERPRRRAHRGTTREYAARTSPNSPREQISSVRDAKRLSEIQLHARRGRKLVHYGCTGNFLRQGFVIGAKRRASVAFLRFTEGSICDSWWVWPNHYPISTGWPPS